MARLLGRSNGYETVSGDSNKYEFDGSVVHGLNLLGGTKEGQIPLGTNWTVHL